MDDISSNKRAVHIVRQFFMYLESEDDAVIRRVGQLLAALRGPDSLGEEIKEKYTSPIRLALMSDKLYNTMKYYPPLPFNRELKIPTRYGHYFDHIITAVQILNDTQPTHL